MLMQKMIQDQTQLKTARCHRSWPCTGKGLGKIQRANKYANAYQDLFRGDIGGKNMTQATEQRSEMETTGERLQEHVTDWQSAGSCVDRELMQVLDVSLAGPTSRNGYEYTEEALRGAIGLYENRPVFLDHAENASRPHERSTRDLVGSIMNVRFEQGRIRGDIQVLDTDSGRTFLALAEKKTAFVGMSHVVMARRNAEKTKVEKIEEVISVDAVVYPATTSTFQEQTAENDLSENLPEKTESLLESELREAKGELASMRSRYNKLLKKYVAVKKRAKKESQVEQLIQEARLPERAMTKQFRELLMEAKTDAVRKRLLQERRQLCSELQRSAPSSTSRGERGIDSIDQAFIRAIKS